MQAGFSDSDCSSSSAVAEREKRSLKDSGLDWSFTLPLLHYGLCAWALYAFLLLSLFSVSDSPLAIARGSRRQLGAPIPE